MDAAGITWETLLALEDAGLLSLHGAAVRAPDDDEAPAYYLTYGQRVLRYEPPQGGPEVALSRLDQRSGSFMTKRGQLDVLSVRLAGQQLARLHPIEFDPAYFQVLQRWVRETYHRATLGTAVRDGAVPLEELEYEALDTE